MQAHLKKPILRHPATYAFTNSSPTGLLTRKVSLHARERSVLIMTCPPDMCSKSPWKNAAIFFAGFSSI